ncbi:uncharacterized protein LOC131307172 [Rhododendron vialii]|uniref:uncharacterized protein LOC131307172 n=1 Tax=Rhododendron vialii TaxID=182163 RepID=UPI00265F96DF|nr:uncharacterized protein LOC131307172 [Rhododendron vialii]
MFDKNIDRDVEFVRLQSNVSFSGSSDEEGGCRKKGGKYTVFNEKTDMANPRFMVGMEFKTHKVLRDAIKEHSIKMGKKIKFKKCDRQKVKAVCQTGCPCEIYGSYVPSDALFRVKKYKSVHECSRSFHVPWVRALNPGTTIKMKVKLNESGQFAKFKRLSICWVELKKGFLQDCRPIIGLDGCHLKGPQGGILLTVVAIDANNCIYPFTYVVVEKEKFKTWNWFLELLIKDLNI